MSLKIAEGVLILGDSPTPSNNITIKTPAVADGSLEIYQGVPGALGDKIFGASANGTEGGIKLGTAVAATGTAIDFTGIPSTAKRVTVMFRLVSTTVTSPPLIQLGTSGGLTISGYSGAAADIIGVQAFLASTGFQLGNGGSSTAIYNGAIVIENFGGNLWVAQGSVGRSDVGQIYLTAGSVALTDVLDRIRVTTLNGTDQFDAGTINISWE